MVGGAGSDVYFVDNPGDLAIENANEGTDTVFSTAHFRLSANVENLVLQGGADLQAGGNSLNNALQGNAGSNILDGCRRRRDGRRRGQRRLLRRQRRRPGDRERQ